MSAALLVHLPVQLLLSSLVGRVRLDADGNLVTRINIHSTKYLGILRWIQHFLRGRELRKWEIVVREGKTLQLEKRLLFGDGLEYCITFPGSPDSCGYTEVMSRKVVQYLCHGPIESEVGHIWSAKYVYFRSQRISRWWWEAHEKVEAQLAVLFGCSERPAVVGRVNLSLYGALAVCIDNMYQSFERGKRHGCVLTAYLPVGRAELKLCVQKRVDEKYCIWYEVVPCRVLVGEHGTKQWVRSYSSPGYGLLKMERLDGYIFFDQFWRDVMRPEIIHQKEVKFIRGGSYREYRFARFTASQLSQVESDWKTVDEVIV